MKTIPTYDLKDISEHRFHIKEWIFVLKAQKIFLWIKEYIRTATTFSPVWKADMSK